MRGNQAGARRLARLGSSDYRTANIPMASIRSGRMNGLLASLGPVGAVLVWMAPALCFGGATGFVNGGLVVWDGIDAFIVTLGTMGIMRSLVAWIPDGDPSRLISRCAMSASRSVTAAALTPRVNPDQSSAVHPICGTGPSNHPVRPTAAFMRSAPRLSSEGNLRHETQFRPQHK